MEPLAQISASSQIRALVLSAREPESSEPDALRQILAQVDDWGRLVQRAAEQRVGGFLLAALAAQGTPAADAIARLQCLGAQTRVQTMRLDRWLERITGAMHRAAIPLMVLKGPSLARTVYESIALRPYDDLDLLVRPCDEPKAVEILSRAGLSETLDPPEEKWARAAGTIPGFAPLHHQFYDPTGTIAIELHTDPLQLGLRPRCDEERWRRARPLPDLHDCMMLAPEDQLVQLSVHALKHGFERLIWLKDLDLLLRLCGRQFDWTVCRDVARREGVSAAVWYSLLVTQHLLGTPVASEQIRALQPSAPTRRLYRRTWTVEEHGVQSQVGCRAVQFTPWESWRGTLPSLLYMGRRVTRLRAALYTAALTCAKQRPRVAVRHGTAMSNGGFEALRASRLG